MFDKAEPTKVERPKTKPAQKKKRKKRRNRR
jgi:hypothetical protein